MLSSKISKEQQAELAIMSELIAHNEGDLALAIEPSSYIVVMESGVSQGDVPGDIQK